MLALPFSTDQFDGAAAIESSGVGLAADPNVMTPAGVRRAVERLLATDHQALRSLATSLARNPGASIAYEAVARGVGDR